MQHLMTGMKSSSLLWWSSNTQTERWWTKLAGTNSTENSGKEGKRQGNRLNRRSGNTRRTENRRLCRTGHQVQKAENRREHGKTKLVEWKQTGETVRTRNKRLPEITDTNSWWSECWRDVCTYTQGTRCDRGEEQDGVYFRMFSYSKTCVFVIAVTLKHSDRRRPDVGFFRSEKGRTRGESEPPS